MSNTSPLKCLFVIVTLAVSIAETAAAAEPGQSGNGQVASVAIQSEPGVTDKNYPVLAETKIHLHSAREKQTVQFLMDELRRQEGPAWEK